MGKDNGPEVLRPKLVVRMNLTTDTVVVDDGRQEVAVDVSELFVEFMAPKLKVIEY